MGKHNHVILLCFLFKYMRERRYIVHKLTKTFSAEYDGEKSKVTRIK